MLTELQGGLFPNIGSGSDCAYNSVDAPLWFIRTLQQYATFTNTERRVQRVRKAVTLEGEMRTDIDILTDLMNAMGYPQPRLTSAQVMDEIARVRVKAPVAVGQILIPNVAGTDGNVVATKAL